MHEQPEHRRRAKRLSSFLPGFSSKISSLVWHEYPLNPIQSLLSQRLLRVSQRPHARLGAHRMPLPAQLQAQDQLCGARYFRAFKAQQNLKSFVLLWFCCVLIMLCFIVLNYKTLLIVGIYYKNWPPFSWLQIKMKVTLFNSSMIYNKITTVLFCCVLFRLDVLFLLRFCCCFVVVLFSFCCGFVLKTDNFVLRRTVS